MQRLVSTMFVSVVMCRSLAQGLATGMAISEEHVLTAYDVVGNQRAVQLKFGDEDWQTADYLDGNSNEGWCLLRLERKAPSFVAVENTKEAESGDEVYVFAAENDANGGISFLDGDIVGVENDFRRGVGIRHSVRVDKSSIGAGLFSEDGNHVIGLIVGNQGRPDRLALSLYGRGVKIRQYLGRQDNATRKSNRKAVCVIRSGAVETAASVRRTSRSNSSNDTNTETYQKCKNSVATVEGEEGSGTGFLCEMDGKKYFVTNRHVAKQRGRMTAYYLDGKQMKFGLDSIIEVAENRDLVRFEIQSERQFLKLSDKTPDIGDSVEFYGNAGGGKVVTVTAGKILAVGQERIEIDCPIQGGNSGSPLVRVADGCVVGVTTISTFNRLSGDASKVGTRYDPNVKLTREFAVRFSGVTWKSMSYGKFLKSINVYRDLCLFYNWMKTVCFADRAVYEYQLPDLQLTTPQLNEFLRKIAKSDEMEKKAKDRLTMMREANRDKGMRRYGQLEFDTAWKTLKNRLTSGYKMRKEILLKTVTFCKSTNALSKEEREDAVDVFDQQYRTYCEKFRMQLKGIFQKPNN